MLQSFTNYHNLKLVFMPASSNFFKGSTAELLGLKESHLVNFPAQSDVKIHRRLAKPLEQLILAGREAGFELSIASGFRSFYRQQRIWNEKCQGLRPVVDDSGHLLAVERLDPLEKVHAIMRWSAIPGTSRHHWGTDIDIYDVSAMPEGYRLQLSPEEYTCGGIFEPMMSWLYGYLEQQKQADFYFPYSEDNGGIACEPWHMSYRPVAVEYQQKQSPSLLKQYLQQLYDENSIEYKIEALDVVLENIETLYPRFILNE